VAQVQRHLDIVDSALFAGGADPSADLMQVSSSFAGKESPAIHSIEEDALEEAGFVSQEGAKTPTGSHSAATLANGIGGMDDILAEEHRQASTRKAVSAALGAAKAHITKNIRNDASKRQLEKRLAHDKRVEAELTTAAKAASTRASDTKVGELEVSLAKAVKKIRSMKRLEKQRSRTKKAGVGITDERTGQRIRESQRFFSYMSRWWRLHRHWMKRHNARLFEKLKEHRALSLSTLWKPFLLRWHYVQPRLAQGYRYDWKNDGTYQTKRFLMKSTKRDAQGVVAARIRSVNNLCFPGFLPAKQRLKWCTYSRRVSARAVQFALEKKLFNPPTITTMRAYTSFIPRRTAVRGIKKGVPRVTFVSLQGLHWVFHEIVEYCDKPASAKVSVPIVFDPKTSSPTRRFSLKYMEWSAIKMDRELLDNGSTVENVVLSTKDGRIKFSCSIPVSHPQSIDGEEVSLTEQKCSAYIRHWDYNLKCPPGKVGSIALVTQITARDDHGSGNGKPTLTPKFKGQLAFNKNKVSMQFEQQAVVHTQHLRKNKTVDSRSSVPVIMTVSKTPQWTSDPRFKSSKLVYFSFIISDTSKLKKGMLHWDPEVRGIFHDQVRRLKLKSSIKSDQFTSTSRRTRPSKPTAQVEHEFEPIAFMQTTQQLRSSATHSRSLGAVTSTMIILGIATLQMLMF